MLEKSPVTECQGCGAWNERHRTLCVLCGTPLAEADEWDATAELPPLPPLPDGGLSVTMPAWLRAVPDEPAALVFPAANEDEEPTDVVLLVSPSPEEDAILLVDAASHEHPPGDPTLAEQPLGPQADPRTFLRDEDFPRWIRELPALPPRPLSPVAVIALPPAVDPSPLAEPPAAPVPVLASPTIGQETSRQNRESVGETAALSHAPTQSPAAAPTDATGRRREPWETPLLVVLVVGVIAAVVWALLSNGLIGSGL